MYNPDYTLSDSINDKLKVIRDYVTMRGYLEQLAEESSEVIKAAIKCIHIDPYESDGAYPVDLTKYELMKCHDDLYNEIVDFIVCIYILYSDSDFVKKCIIPTDEIIEERLDKMLTRIKERNSNGND